MRAQWMADGQAGMFEIAGGVARHSDFLHHADGAVICGRGEGNDFVEPDIFERVARDG